MEAPGTDCQATVGEFSRCTDARLEMFRELSTQDCAELLAGSDQPSPARAICEVIPDSCFVRFIASESAP
jgi:hypothetical protein